MALTNRRQRIARRQMAILELTTPQVAEKIGCTVAHLSNVLHGRAHPSNAVRKGLPKALGLPIEALLDPELLQTEYSGHRGARAQKRGA